MEKDVFSKESYLSLKELTISMSLKFCEKRIRISLATELPTLVILRYTSSSLRTIENSKRALTASLFCLSVIAIVIKVAIAINAEAIALNIIQKDSHIIITFTCFYLSAANNRYRA